MASSIVQAANIVNIRDFLWSASQTIAFDYKWQNFCANAFILAFSIIIIIIIWVNDIYKSKIKKRKHILKI